MPFLFFTWSAVKEPLLWSVPSSARISYASKFLQADEPYDNGRQSSESFSFPAETLYLWPVPSSLDESSDCPEHLWSAVLPKIFHEFFYRLFLNIQFKSVFAYLTAEEEQITFLFVSHFRVPPVSLRNWSNNWLSLSSSDFPPAIFAAEAIARPVISALQFLDRFFPFNGLSLLPTRSCCPLCSPLLPEYGHTLPLRFFLHFYDLNRLPVLLRLTPLHILVSF